MQVEIAAHKPYIHHAQHGEHGKEIEGTICLGGSKEAYGYESLHCHIKGADGYMRPMQLVGKELVEVLAMRQPYILMQHKAVHDGEHAVDTIY